jgi:hypothetical protein
MEFDEAFEHVCVPMYLIRWRGAWYQNHDLYKRPQTTQDLDSSVKCTGRNVQK